MEITQWWAPSLLLASHCPELNHLATPSYKEGWKFESVIVSHVPSLNFARINKRRMEAMRC